MCYVFFYLLVYWLSCTFLVTSFKKSTSNEPIEKKGILIKYIWGADDPPTPPTPPPSVTVVIINILIKIIINSISQSIKKPFIFSSTQSLQKCLKNAENKKVTWHLAFVYCKCGMASIEEIPNKISQIQMWKQQTNELKLPTLHDVMEIQATM